MALQKFSFFPFAISMDSWRWGVFNGSIPESEYNSKWWEIREKNQGISPPSPRTAEGLDASAKYHIVANVEYIRYFVSHILQFQFYEHMCIAAKEYNYTDPNSKPLYQCDFAGSTDAGNLFGEMMKLGFKEPWPVALEKITGSKSMDIGSLQKYFEPLFEYMTKELVANGEQPGFSTEFQEEVADQYVSGFYETEASKHCNLASVADFTYQTDLTNKTAEDASTAANIAWANFESQQYAEEISQFDFESFTDESLKRQLKFMNAIGTSALSSEDLKRYNDVLSEMSKIYGTAKVCPFTKQNCSLETEGLNLEPELTEILGKLENYDELAYLWKGWRDASGKKMRELYLEYVELSNKAAVANNYANMGDFWLLRYELETEEFRTDLEEVWQEVKTALYEPLYDYVRFKLSKKFTEMDPEGPIPAHVLGNMWSQTWEYVLPYVLPNPAEPAFDITETLLDKTSTLPDELKKREFIFEKANEFFASLGLADMTVAYKAPAMIVKPADNKTEVICHASAWDMCDKKDFRLKMCTEINHQDFITAHHELGHIQYYLQYIDKPITYRTGANPGFHEAIGDVVALSVSTPKHLKEIGFIKDDPSDGSKLNFLMQMALDKIAFLPFGYLIDSYRWQIFSGAIPPGNLTYNWLKMRAEFQGIVPPVKRSEADFDAGAKYHVPANTPYIRYFVSYILQFQVHQALCKEAGHLDSDPLSECDIYKNQKAGKLFESILKAGGSENWQELLKRVTGDSNKLNATAIIAYFKPLTDYLKAQQVAEGYYTGFNVGNFEDYFEPSTEASTESSTEADSDEDDEEKNVAAIVVGIILGAVVVVILVGYMLGKRCRK